MSGTSEETLGELAERLSRALPARADPESAASCRGLVERAGGLAEAAARRSEEASDPALLVIGRLAAGLAAGGLHEAARRVLEGALRAAERNAPADLFLTAALHDQVAESFQSEGRAEEALEHARQAERYGRAACRPDDPRLLGLLNNVGSTHKRAGEFLTAEVHFRRALALADSQGLASGPLRATATLNLSDVLRAQGRPEAALMYAERGLAETEEAYGPTSFETADAAGGLAALLWELGEAAVARRCQRRTAALHERALGRDHELTRAARKRLEEMEGMKPGERGRIAEDRDGGSTPARGAEG